MKVAFFKNLKDNQVRCRVCPHNCRIKPGGYGVCKVRANENGTLWALNYAEVSSVVLDPIEKKPLYHFYPGTNILSVGTVGCNLACGFCQNHSIAHESPPTRRLEAHELLELALECSSRRSVGVAYTYSEPLMWYEYVREAAPLLKEKGQKNVLVTNGFINQPPLLELLPFIDAMNIDLKAFTERFYHANCKGRLEPVKNTIETCVGRTHVELTTLVIPGHNDRPEEIDELSRWVASLDPDIPLHLSAYHPAYKFNLPPTPFRTLSEARQAALAHLRHVYVGNIGGFDNNTYCHHCGEVLVERSGYQVELRHLDGHKCGACGKEVPIL